MFNIFTVSGTVTVAGSVIKEFFQRDQWLKYT
jgi:hypothetical protein